MDSDMELVLDTLYDRRQSDRQGCFTVNRAGLSLLKSPLSIVPVIEQVLREIVEPALSGGRTESSQFPALDPMWNDVIRYNPAASEFPGLDYVLGAYLVLGVKLNPDRVVSFLSTLSAPLLAEAIQNIPVFFAPKGQGYNPGIPPGHELKKFVQDMEKAEWEDVRTAAARVMERMAENECS